jgi:hypothetical protein
MGHRGRGILAHPVKAHGDNALVDILLIGDIAPCPILPLQRLRVPHESHRVRLEAILTQLLHRAKPVLICHARGGTARGVGV